MPVWHNTAQIIARVKMRAAAVGPGSPQIREALTRIGLYVTTLAKLNVRGKNLIDTGRLLNSIRYEFFTEGNVSGIRIGSFNVPYAAVHEFGYTGQQQVPAHKRLISKAWGRPIPTQLVTVPAHTRMMRIKKRAYLRPAITTARPFIVDTLRAALVMQK
jgi:phage gpG-like protein